MNKIVECVAACLRDARLCGIDWTAEDMRAYIVRDLAREFRGIYPSFNVARFYDLCDITEEQRKVKPNRMEDIGK